MRQVQVSHWKKEARSGRRKFYSREPSHNAESAKERERERFLQPLAQRDAQRQPHAVRQPQRRVCVASGHATALEVVVDQPPLEAAKEHEVDHEGGAKPVFAQECAQGGEARWNVAKLGARGAAPRDGSGADRCP
jgi:hypothetical protein